MITPAEAQAHTENPQFLWDHDADAILFDLLEERAESYCEYAQVQLVGPNEHRYVTCTGSLTADPAAAYWVTNPKHHTESRRWGVGSALVRRIVTDPEPEEHKDNTFTAEPVETEDGTTYRYGSCIARPSLGDVWLEDAQRAYSPDDARRIAYELLAAANHAEGEEWES